MKHMIPLALTVALGTATLAAMPQSANAFIPDDAMVFKASSHSKTRGCPPGLAKKSPACVPPGLAKKVMPYVIGDRINPGYDDVIRVREPGLYGLDPYATYYRVDNRVVEVNSQTMEIVRLIGAVSDILN
ncbi:hypothetical protein DL237_06150 [Pseudooceanicola sediminis]|uniref:Excinuclease ABC subunit A n=1 Tax=Pseudooceanicola sediminis TaxID=2211117 RepID=A0A399J2S3_9RHOB|nr:hypothetical protein [Pseudooceanicola sediminis]KAA2317370.1 hypothetical protein E0K93_03525 [Puniceibacterium sp. HSS470]RII39723.1 hypothetical protein DL237_06150 [Pseudooceanicola sediminis]|tara:strand:+ start:12970 stop:13359 length:390 start_codon:yes stop_codon:yes gene_type:complete